MSTPLCSASLREATSARVLKPMMTAFDASARLTSDSVMPPTAACTMFTLTPAPGSRGGEHDVAALQRSRVNEHGRERTFALVKAGFNHYSLRQRIARRLELEHFGLQQYRVEQIVDALAGLCRYLDELCLAAVFLGEHALGDELLLDAVRIRFRLVDLVDRDDDRHIDGFGVC